VKFICTNVIIAVGRWRVCFWVATIPATLQALGMEFCAESPQWLYKVLLLWHIAWFLCYVSDLSSQTCMFVSLVTHMDAAVFLLPVENGWVT